MNTIAALATSPQIMRMMSRHVESSTEVTSLTETKRLSKAIENTVGNKNGISLIHPHVFPIVVPPSKLLQLGGFDYSAGILCMDFPKRRPTLSTVMMILKV
jgi:hypothetical protein